MAEKHESDNGKGQLLKGEPKIEKADWKKDGSDN
jgi:hypothetical protein